MIERDRRQLALGRLDLHHLDQKHPKYERLKSYLMDEMTSGRLGPGDALPSEQQLTKTKTLKVARTTVRHALCELSRDGFIHRVQGKGTFVSEKINGQDVHIDVQTDNRFRQGLEALAMVTPETKIAFYPSLLDGFENASSRLHQQTLVGNSRDDLDVQARIMLQLFDKRVAGIAVVPVGVSPTPPYQIRQLQQHGVPVVFCHRSVEGIDAPTQLVPFYDIGRKAGEAITRQGHRRVAFFFFSTEKREDGLELPMLKGLRDAIRAGGGQLPDEFCCQFPFSSVELGQHEDEVFETLMRICRHPDRPTAIMSSFDNLAELLYLQLGWLGLRVPEDISLIGFGGTERRGAIQRQLTSVAIDEAQVGRRAAELLGEIRSGKRPITDNEKIIIPLAMTDGQTLGSAPQEIVPINNENIFGVTGGGEGAAK